MRAQRRLLDEWLGAHWLQGAAHQFAEAAVEGFVLGFLGPTVEIDVDATLALADEFGSMPWTFHRAVDHALDYDRAWQRLRMMPSAPC